MGGKDRRQMSMDRGAIEIREVASDEFVETVRGVADYAFGPSPRARDLEEARRRLPYLEKARHVAAFFDGEPQATLSSHEMTQNLRGAIVPMGGIAAVASMPAARRRGIVRQLFERVFAIHREMGMPVSVLYPFRDSFYERMGYASVPQPRYLTIKPETLAPLVRHEKPGTCEQAPMKDAFDEWRAFIERIQARTHGFALKHISNALAWRDANEWWVAFARHEGELVGAMTFRITDYGGKLEASTFYTLDSVGRYQLLDWIGRHTDQVAEAIIAVRPDDYPETWFRDTNAVVRSDVEHAWPAPMARVVDVAKLGGVGAGEGEVTLAVHDALCPWNDGAFTFRAERGTLAVEASDTVDAPRITIQGLSALVFSGHDPADFAFRGWGEPDKATVDALRRLFPRAIPDIHEEF
jgi:predicted acetyltransferase